MNFQNIFKKEGVYMATGLPEQTYFFVSDDGLYQLHRPDEDTEKSVLKKHAVTALDFKRQCKKIDINNRPEDVKLGWLMEDNPFKYSISFYLGENGYFRFDSILSVEVYEVSKTDYNVTFNTTRPGLLIGKAGKLINGLKQYLMEYHKLTHLEFNINEVKPAIYPPAYYDYYF
jgi:predicted RNA-binding protein Jag